MLSLLNSYERSALFWGGLSVRGGIFLPTVCWSHKPAGPKEVSWNRRASLECGYTLVASRPNRKCPGAQSLLSTPEEAAYQAD